MKTSVYDRSIITSVRISPMEYEAIQILSEMFCRSKNDVIASSPLLKLAELTSGQSQKGDNIMTIEEAKALLTPEKIEKLKEMVIPKPSINTENKSNNDILMNALCVAAEKEIIHPNALDDKILKLLNSATNTLSSSKLEYVLNHVHKTQANIVCCITIKDKDHNVVKQWDYYGPNVSFNSLFEYVVDKFEITPQSIRSTMTKMLKPTIVNNIAQLVAKYDTLDDNEKKKLNISITTITRLVNMSGYLIFAEFTVLENIK